MALSDHGYDLFLFTNTCFKICKYTFTFLKVHKHSISSRIFVFYFRSNYFIADYILLCHFIFLLLFRVLFISTLPFFSYYLFVDGFCNVIYVARSLTWTLKSMTSEANCKYLLIKIILFNPSLVLKTHGALNAFGKKKLFHWISW